MRPNISGLTNWSDSVAVSAWTVPAADEARGLSNWISYWSPLIIVGSLFWTVNVPCTKPVAVEFVIWPSVTKTFGRWYMAERSAGVSDGVGAAGLGVWANAGEAGRRIIPVANASARIDPRFMLSY